MRAEDALDKGASNLVLDRVLFFACCGNEELVLDVDKVLAIVDYLDIGVCDGVLEVVSHQSNIPLSFSVEAL